jgi:tetratricopeptide (TPR) repeat protein
MKLFRPNANAKANHGSLSGVSAKSQCRFSFFPVFLLSAAVCLLVSACSMDLPRFGIGGRYIEGRDEFLKVRGGNMDRAISALESVVRQEPTYRDSLTLLARAYYRKQRYSDALQIAQRALAVNKNDEVAWLVLGLAQLRLERNTEGLESLKGGVGLLSQVATSGYRDYPEWDRNHLVRNSIRRAAFDIAKGLEAKTAIIQSVETLLSRMDDEESLQRQEQFHYEKMT